MREIKFRAWNKELKIMKDEFNLFSKGKIFSIYSEAFKGYGQKFEENYEIMQFTGLLDKKGKEIYEGDVLIIVEENNSNHGFNLEIGQMIAIKWMDGGFRIIQPAYWDNEKKGYCEVCASVGYLFSENHEIPIGQYATIIGNIYENPELLK